jgi:Putative beta-barrel porin-2, OmpL-like. bbp2
VTIRQQTASVGLTLADFVHGNRQGINPMTRSFSTGLRVGTACLIAMAWQLADLPAAWAQQAPPGAPAAAPPAPTPMTTPAISGPLVANPDPMHLDIVPFFGPMYVTGAVSGLGLVQTDPILGLDRRTTLDIANAQASLQTTEGMFQFFIEPGIYALPTVGVPYKGVADMPTSTNVFGGLPIAWGKIVFNDNFSIQGGKLPTLIGAEYMFTFQNMNIQRGLLWAQENLVNRGIQANLATGPLAWSLSVNDGFYTGEYNYITGSAAWTINPTNSVILTGGGPFSRITATGTPLGPQYNNSTIIEASYSYINAPLTITPYIQYTHVDRDTGLGTVDSSTFGGAVLASYAFTDHVSLAGRWEYIDSSGAATVGGTGLLGYGAGSSAMSFTLTPTFQSGIYFLRGEASVTQLSSITAGAGFGSGNSRTQARFLLETGVVF